MPELSATVPSSNSYNAPRIQGTSAAEAKDATTETSGTENRPTTGGVAMAPDAPGSMYVKIPARTGARTAHTCTSSDVLT